MLKQTKKIETTYNINFVNDFLWVRDFEQLKNKYSSQPWKKLILRLENLRKWLLKEYWETIDPVQYLYSLYYINRISMRDVIKKTTELWETFNNDPSWFSKMMRNDFEWIPRWNHEETPSKLDKDKNKKTNEKIKETKSFVEEIVQKSKWDNFCRTKCEGYRSDREKIRYILFSYGVLKTNDTKWLRNFINETMERKKIWGNRMAQIIKWIIYKKLPLYTFTIESWNVYIWSGRKQELRQQKKS